MSKDSTRITRRGAITAALASAAVPMVATIPALAIGSGEDAAMLARAEQIIDLLRTRYICEGWTLDEKRASHTLECFRQRLLDDDQEWEAVVRFFGDHGQSLDWVISGNPGGMICGAAASSSAARSSAAVTDPVFAAIEAHRRAFNAPGFHSDDDAEMNAAGDVLHATEDALLALTPATAAGALAVLQYARDIAEKRQFGLFPAEDFELPIPLLDWSQRAIAAIDAQRG